MFSDGTAQTMTRSVQWAVDDQSLGYFGTPGVVTLLAPGSTTVRAVAGSVAGAGPARRRPVRSGPAGDLPGLAGPAAGRRHLHPALGLGHAPGRRPSPRPGGGLEHERARRSPSPPSGTSWPCRRGWPRWSPTPGPARGAGDGRVHRRRRGELARLAAGVGRPGGRRGDAGARTHPLPTGRSRTSPGSTGWRDADGDAGTVDVETGETGGTVRPRQPGARVSVLAVLPGKIGLGWVRSPAGKPTLEIVPPAGAFPVGARTRLAAVGHWPDGTVVDVTGGRELERDAGRGPGRRGRPERRAGPRSRRRGEHRAGALRRRDGAGGPRGRGPRPATLEVWPPASDPGRRHGPAALGDPGLRLRRLDRRHRRRRLDLQRAAGGAGDQRARASRASCWVWRRGPPCSPRGWTASRPPLPVVVSTATLTGVEVQALSAAVTWAPARFVAIGRFSDGTTQDLTRWVSWTSSEPGRPAGAGHRSGAGKRARSRRRGGRW